MNKNNLFNQISVTIVLAGVLLLSACSPAAPATQSPPAATPAPPVQTNMPPSTSGPVVTSSPPVITTPPPIVTATPSPVIPVTTTPAAPPPPAPPARIDYGAIDQYAWNTPPAEEVSVDRLTAYLIKTSKNDTEKARAIYAWITDRISYNIKDFLSRTQSDQSPAAVLARRDAVCQGYSALYEAMAKAAGLSVKFVGGLSRDNFTETIDHAWNAVQVNGKWALIDSTWGSGSLDTSTNTFVLQFDEFFFLTPPEQFVYSHLPEDQQWQLLTAPLSKDVFMALPIVTNTFFDFGMQLGGNKQGTITAGQNLSLSFPAPAGILTMAKLSQGGSPLADSLTFSQRASDSCQIDSVFPAAGDYNLQIYAKKATDSGNNFTLAVEFQVKASQGAGAQSGFPQIYTDFANKGAYLYTPKIGNLPIASGQVFKLDVPGAEEVVVIINGKDWNKLTKNGNSFEGTVTISSGQIQVGAKYPGESNYRVLLSYTGS